MSVSVHAAHHYWLGKAPPISPSFNRNWFNGRGRSKQINPMFQNSTGGTPSQEPNKKIPLLLLACTSLTQPVNLSHVSPPPRKEQRRCKCLPPSARADAESHTREEAWCTHSSQKSALFSTKWCTTMAAVPQIRAGGGQEGDPMGTQLPGRQKHRHGKKGAGTGRADYFKDGMWAGGSKRARLDMMWNLQQDLSSLAEQMEIRFFITAEKISDN